MSAQTSPSAAPSSATPMPHDTAVATHDAPRTENTLRARRLASPRLSPSEFSALVASLSDRVKAMQQDVNLSDEQQLQIESMKKTINKCAHHVQMAERAESEKFQKQLRDFGRVINRGNIRDFNKLFEDRGMLSYIWRQQKAERDTQDIDILLQDAEHELAKIEQEIIEKLKREAEEEREWLKRKSVRGKTLLEDGFPNPCPSPTGNKAKPFICTSCIGFQVGLDRPEDSIFRALRTLPPRKFARGITWEKTSDMRVSTDFAKPSFIRKVMVETAHTYQQSCEIIENAGLADSNPSISVSRSLQELTAAVHVAMPYDDFGDVPCRHMSKYLGRLRLDYGVSAPIGIITSYDKWQFCWHKYASPVAEATTIEEVKNFCAPEPVDADFDSLCVSPVYSYDNPCLLQLLASFLVKAAHIPSCAPVTKPWLLYTRNEQRIRLGRLDLAKVRHFDMVPESADDKLFWVKLMGRDSEGLVLKMATKDGECCAAKFCDVSRAELLNLKGNSSAILKMRQKLCQEERDRWVEAYGKDCGVRVTQLAGRPVVLMPFYEPLSDADWEAPETMKMVMAHIEELATRDDEEEKRNGTGKRWVLHTDMRRRHVMWGDKDHTCVRLIDWGRYGDFSCTADEVRARIGRRWSPERKRIHVASHLQAYLVAARNSLAYYFPENTAGIDEVFTPDLVEDDYGEDYKTAFEDRFAELYDHDRAAFHAEMRKQSKGGGRRKWRKRPPPAAEVGVVTRSMANALRIYSD